MLQGVAATQLLLLRQPLAPHLLVKPGVLQFLLQMWSNVAAFYTLQHPDDYPQQWFGCVVPPSCWNMADGSLHFTGDTAPQFVQDHVRKVSMQYVVSCWSLVVGRGCAPTS